MNEGKVMVGEPDDVNPQQQKEKKFDYTFGVFIDGTLNNRANTESRQNYEKMKAGAKKSTDPNALDDPNSYNADSAAHYNIKALGKTQAADKLEFDKRGAGKAYYPNKFEEFEPKEDSYENDLSNPAILYKYYKKDKDIRVLKTYTEGIGTMDYTEDDTEGTGFGTGDRGIVAKVRKALESLANQVTDAYIGRLTIDVFGFSRGAAAARNLVYEITLAPYQPHSGGRGGSFMDHNDYAVLPTGFIDHQLPRHGYLGYLLQLNNKTVDFVQVRFAGLFDTVAHNGVYQGNDVNELGLYAINQAKTVVHFTAGDEHRANFDLSTISSVGGNRAPGKFLPCSIPTNVGIERLLPGVHCDIGGSYVDCKPEHNNRIEADSSKERLEAKKDWLVAQGWYQQTELYITSPGQDNEFRFMDGQYALHGYRRCLGNQYSFIPLHFMCRLAIEKQGLPFNEKGLLDLYDFKANKIPNNVWFLNQIKNRLHDYVFGDGLALELEPPVFSPGTGSFINDMKTHALEIATAEEKNKHLKHLRNNYLHWNAKWGGTGEPHHPNSNWQRDVLDGRKS